MKVEVSRQDVSDSAAMLQQLEQWEEFLGVAQDGVLLLKVGNLNVSTSISNHGIGQLEYIANSKGKDRLAYLELAIAKLCQQRSQDLAKEVCELIRKSMPLPLEQSPSK